MPFAASYMDEEEKKKNQQGPSAGVNISGGASADIATGVPGQDASTAAKAPKSSGQYANIQSYLDANKDQADQMGTTIASNVSSKADDATSKIQGLEAKAPEVKAYDPNAAYSKLGSLTDDDKNEYRTQKATGGYTGPSSVDQVDGYQDAMKASNEASGLVKNAGNESGQQALLKDTYKRANYTAGENKLDQALLQNSAGSKQALEGLSSKYAGLSGMFDQANQKVGNAVNNATATALKNKEGIATAEKAQWENMINPIQARADQMYRDNTGLAYRLSGDISDDALTDETMGQFGVSEGQNLYNLALGNYLNTGGLKTQVGLNQAANDQERSRYQALADLVQDSSRNQITADGKLASSPAFNKDLFNKDYAAQKAEYERNLNPLVAERDSLENEWNQMLGQWQQGNYFDESLQSYLDSADKGNQHPLARRMRDVRGRLDQLPSQIDNVNASFRSGRKVTKG